MLPDHHSTHSKLRTIFTVREITAHEQLRIQSTSGGKLILRQKACLSLAAVNAFCKGYFRGGQKICLWTLTAVVGWMTTLRGTASQTPRGTLDSPLTGKTSLLGQCKGQRRSAPFAV